ncbi:eukaryotic mitochondrial regulator protein-domain-containing protein [Immersiella caudata]|uniref:Eukaryotic mitochondrial regulator protein-domain-containing protein n=1 Tax=Immersiella caudata TaxID=314043 RepID=A0AA39XHG1_9PEZI|nr:eukaryotic mitochondrial regulator protein-domain-containing protein [Immersiella caudata]
MPPRLPTGCSAQLVNCLDRSSLCTTQRAATAAGRPSWPSPATQQSSAFSTTAPRDLTINQRRFWKWARKGLGKTLRSPKPGQTNYMPSGSNSSRADVPFPTNPAFRSSPVLSDEARERIWENVMKKGLPLKAVSARHGVDMRRVAAVIRLKELEKAWEAQGKPMAIPYSKAVLSMVPTHDCAPDSPPFEAINEMHVHSYTQQQIFLPTSESRHFTRADAAKAFGEKILPPEKKMWVPELLQLEKDIASGVGIQEARSRFLQATAKSELEMAEKHAKKDAIANEENVRVNTDRFQFRFEGISVDSSGKTGRHIRGVGWRYGVPHNDRKPGAVKIPTKVE